jgi:hypothetical protein
MEMSHMEMTHNNTYKQPKVLLDEISLKTINNHLCALSEKHFQGLLRLNLD